MKQPYRHALRRLYTRSRRSHLLPLISRLYDATIALELAVQRHLDTAAAPQLEPGAPILNDLTAIVKTFERPRIVQRLIASIQRLYPSLQVIVADDSRTPTPLPNVEWIELPYDSGVSAGRAAALERVQTPYVLVLDDDFILSRHTRLAETLRIMEEHPPLDIVGGSVIDLPFMVQRRYAAFSKQALARQQHLEGTWEIGGLPLYVKVPNFYLARTERLRLVGWNPEIKRLDHADFFWRAFGILTVALNVNLQCFHAQTPFDLKYVQKREEIAPDLALFKERLEQR